MLQKHEVMVGGLLENSMKRLHVKSGGKNSELELKYENNMEWGAPNVEFGLAGKCVREK